jgi:predicted DNA-binding antitoxin AbrB/MazE fold protein
MINKDDKPQQKYDLKGKKKDVFIINNHDINKDLTKVGKPNEFQVYIMKDSM